MGEKRGKIKAGMYCCRYCGSSTQVTCYIWRACWDTEKEPIISLLAQAVKKWQPVVVRICFSFVHVFHICNTTYYIKFHYMRSCLLWYDSDWRRKNRSWPIDQSTNYLIDNQLIDQLISNQPINQPNNQTTHWQWPTELSTDQSTNQPTDWSSQFNRLLCGLVP